MHVPKYRKNGDGRAFAVYPKSGGRREYFGKYGTEEAENKYREWLTRLLTSDGLLHQEKQQSEYLVVELAVKYLDHVKPRRSAATYRFIDRCLTWLVEMFGTELGVNITPKVLVQYQQMLVNKEYTKNNKTHQYKRKTINQATHQIKNFVKWCCKWEYLPAEQWLRLTTVGNLEKGEYGAVDNPKILPVSFETVKKTLPYMNYLVGVMAQVQYYCGMRPGEVCNLNWEEIDKSQEVWIYVPIDHKTSHKNWRLMKAVPPVAQRLLDSPTFKESEFIFDPIHVSNGIKPNKRYSSNTYAAAVRRACTRAIKKGVIEKAWTPNQLRHAIATDIRSLYGREAAQDYLGHSSIDTTGIYAERTKERIQSLAQKLEKDLFSK